MSGSIGGNRIKHERVMPTCLKYLDKVLKGFNGFEGFSCTGSYKARPKEDYGDIDLVVWINLPDDLKTIKKKFQNYLNSLPNYITPPFRSGKRQGHKSQMFGNIVTCQIPIQGQEDNFVQIDNIIVKSKEELEFVEHYLNLDAQIQTLLTASVRVLPRIIVEQDLSYIKWSFHQDINIPILKDNEEFEVVISMFKLTIRKVTLDENKKELSREIVWETTNWTFTEIFIKESLGQPNIHYNNYTFESLLNFVNNFYEDDERAKRRICGIMNSMINIGPGEVGTEKGIKKQEAIDLAYKILNINK